MSINNKKRGFTLIELIVSIGLFSIVVLMTSGAYFIMISINRQAQGIATGINSLSFALETMTRTIRTGTSYKCPAVTGGDCSGGTSFSVVNAGNEISYTLSGGVINQNGIALTDQSVNVSSLVFYVSGTAKPPGDLRQPRVTMIVSGDVSYGPKPEQKKSFTVETGATMRGSDL